MAWKCPVCSFKNDDSVIRCICGYEEGKWNGMKGMTINNNELVAEIKTNMEHKTTEELTRLYEEHNENEWSQEAFEAMRQLLVQRGKTVLIPLQKIVRAKTSKDFLKVLSPMSNCPCMRCGEKNRTLRFRRLRFSYGFMYWIRTHIWIGYICDACAVGTTLGCFLAGFGSFFLLHPFAFYWTPVRLIQNLWNTVVGFTPRSPIAFENNELEQGMVTSSVAKGIAGKATQLIAGDPTQTSGPILGAIAILSGYAEAPFVEQVQNALLSSRHRTWGKTWVRRINKSLNIYKVDLPNISKDQSVLESRGSMLEEHYCHSCYKWVSVPKGTGCCPNCGKSIPV